MEYQSPKEYVLDLEKRECGPMGWNIPSGYVSPFNKPDVCPECGSSDVHRADTWPGCWGGIVLSGDCYWCGGCGFSEKSVSFVLKGTHLPESNWWSITKYPISWWETTIQNGAKEILMHYESIDTIKSRMDHASDMIARLK